MDTLIAIKITRIHLLLTIKKLCFIKKYRHNYTLVNLFLIGFSTKVRADVLIILIIHVLFKKRIVQCKNKNKVEFTRRVNNQKQSFIYYWRNTKIK